MFMRSLFLLLMVLAAVLVGCDSAYEESGVATVQQRLVGTWLREYDEEGAHVRRVLVLEADGRFREMSTVLAPGADRLDSQGTGTWLFDGTNLKRHYATLNGKALSAPTLPFATFALSFPSKGEFIGVDHVHKREVHYERVPDGTEP